MAVEERLRTKWVATAASIWVQCTSGGSYTFGIYSSVLKSTQSYDQSTLDTVSVFKDIGANAGVFSGLLYTAATSNRRRGPGGPWIVLAVGAVQCFAGYFLIWSSVAGLISRPPVPLMCMFMFLAAQSQTFFNTANVVSAVENFARFGGTAVGIMKGFLGLSGAMLIQLYETVCSENPAGFILLLAITPTLLSLLVMPLVRIYETSPDDDKKHLDGLSAISLIIAAYLMVIIVLKSTLGLSLWANFVSLAFLLLLLTLPLLIARIAHRESTEKSSSPAYSPLIGNSEPTTSGKKISGRDGQIEGDRDETLVSNEESLNLLQAMSTVNFWLLFLAMICGMGSGLSTINNIRQIGESLRYSTIEINTLVSLWSIWNFLGRFGAGYASDVLLQKKGWPRPLLMAVTLAAMTVGHLIIASGFQGNLYVGSVIVGVCYGSQWSLMPTITSELFGVQHMGTIFNTVSIASPIGSYIFSVRLIGYIYDKIVSGKGNTCYGPHCFMLSFMIMASVAFFGFLVACGLLFRTKALYRQIVAKRLRH